MLAYQLQDSPLTLAEGLAEYYAAFAGLKRGAGLAPAAKDFFARHDAVHVMWGCGTSLPHEAIVKLSSFFGTSGGFSVMRGYMHYDSQDIYRQLKLGEVLWTILLSVVLVPRTLARCFGQRKKWPWKDYDALLYRPLAALRQEFGVKVAVRVVSDATARSPASPSRTRGT